MIGKDVSGFKIVDVIGEGGMGKVYKAFQASLERYVAIKTIPHQLALDKVLLDRFYTEAKSLARLNHPNIIGVFDVFEVDHIHYIAMEYVEGTTLGRLIIDKGPMSESQTVFILKSVGDALSAAHAVGIIHRDIKPDNIMVTHDSRIKLMDFGLARDTTTKGMTVTGNIMGTPEYMSPEQCEGKTLDGSTDLYSLGITIFEALVGATPFLGKSVGEIIRIKTGEDSSRIEKFRKDISKDLAYVVNRLIEHDSHVRYHDIHQLMHDLRTSRFDVGARPDKITILTDSQVVGVKTPTLTAFKRTFTRDIRYWGRREIVWFIIIATAFLSATMWGVVKFKEKYNIQSLVRSLRPLTDNEKEIVALNLAVAKSAYQDKLFPEALAAIEKVLSVDLKNSEAKDLKKEILRMTQNVDDLFDESMSLIDQAKYEEAILKLEQVMASNPRGYEEDARVNIVKAYNNMGAEYNTRRLFDKAVECFLKAHEWEPENPVVLLNLAIALHAAKRYGECIAYGEKAIELNPVPSDPEQFFYQTYLTLGSSALQMEKFGKALQFFRTGLEHLRGTSFVRLKNGDNFFGKLIENKDDIFVFRVPSGRMEILSSDLIRMENMEETFTDLIERVNVEMAKRERMGQVSN